MGHCCSKCCSGGQEKDSSQSDPSNVAKPPTQGQVVPKPQQVPQPAPKQPAIHQKAAEDVKGPPANVQAKVHGPPRPKENWILPAERTQDVRLAYEFGQVLGKGQFGTTRLVTDKITGERFACKSISKKKLQNKEDRDDVKREVQIMHHLAGHPNVVTLKQAFEDAQYIHLVMELCSGGELFDRIVERQRYTEKDAAAAIRTILKVVAHCHSMNVMHRDLKPENFLLSDTTDRALLKATDFGLSVFFKEGQEFQDIVGSAYYVAPEVLNRKYSQEADIWSCGVILYILLSGVPPFFGKTEHEIFESVTKSPINFTNDPWPKVSDHAKDCVRRMLVRNPRKRATAEEILRHDWIRENGVASDRVIEPEVLNRIRNFSAMNQLKKRALMHIARTLPPEEIQGLREMFEAMDADKSGSISIHELREGLRKKGTKLAESELQIIMSRADVNGDGTIDFNEFLAATLHLSKVQREENMYKAFQHFDKDNSGYITIDEVEAALQNMQNDDDVAVMEQIQEVIMLCDKDRDGKIDYQEFKEMMMEGQDDFEGDANLFRDMVF